MKLRLYHYWRSSCSWRVRWALLIKGVPCEFESIDLLSDETDQPPQRARNPIGYVPVLELLNSQDPFRFIAESIAIIEWLEETIPTPSLLPGTPLQRARIRQLAEIINSGTQPLQNLNVMARYSIDPTEQRKWNQHWIHQGLHAYEVLVTKTSGLYSIGDTLTLADLCLIPQCYNAIRYELGLSDFPVIEKIYSTALKTPSCQGSAPESFKTSKPDKS